MNEEIDLNYLARAVASALVIGVILLCGVKYLDGDNHNLGTIQLDSRG